MTDDTTEGKVDQLKGRGQEALGALTGDQDEKEKGRSTQTKGKGKEVVGDVKDAIDDATGS